ncbi:MAG: SH3 domain-containing protein [Phototrophicaceae bacterium]
MRQTSCILIIIIVCTLAACSSAPSATIVELDGGAIPTVTQRIIYVTATNQPTPIPTVSLITDVPTLAPISASSTPDLSAAEAVCTETLERLYTEASEFCIGEPSGFFCNGGLPPQAQASGNVVNVSNTMAQQGSLVPIDVVASVQTSALLSSNSGGVMWVRINDPIEINALMLGDVEIRDVTPPNSNLEPWQLLSVVTGDAANEPRSCASQSYSTFIVQGPWGRETDFVINGISIELTGSIAIQTTSDASYIIVLEGQTYLTVFGQRSLIVAGQQLLVPHEEGNFVQPSGVPSAPELLDFDRIANIPVPLLDRPLLLPQPGFAQTNGNVNMRSQPTTNSRILAEVPDGQLLSIIGMNPERSWYHVRLPNGDNGWMSAELVTGEIGDISLTYAETPEPPERFGEASNRGIVVAQSGANLRNAPDVQFQLIQVLPENTEVEILARSPYSPFVKVDSIGGVGWLALITIETNTVIQFLPIDYDVPQPPGPTATPFFAFGGGHAYPDPRSGN